MSGERGVTLWSRNRSWMGTIITAIAVGLLATVPSLLVPIARAYRDLCARYPVLAPVTGHLPPLPAALLVTIVLLALINGGVVGVPGLVGTLRFNRGLTVHACPLPTRLARIGERLGLTDRLTYLDAPVAMACCYGFARPRVAVSAGLLARLDDDELLAVLAHERHHVEREDPARYLGLRILAAAAFMFPVARAFRLRQEARIELAADRAALAVASRGALAGALLTVLKNSETSSFVGAAGLSATEARIAHLAGASVLPAIPARAAFASLAVMSIIVVATGHLATSAQLVQMACRFCTGILSS